MHTLKERNEVLLVAVDRLRDVLEEVELNHEVGDEAEHPLQRRWTPSVTESISRTIRYTTRNVIHGITCVTIHVFSRVTIRATDTWHHLLAGRGFEAAGRARVL